MREMLHEAVGEPLAAAALPATVLSFSDQQPAGLDARLHTAIACTIAEKRLSLSLFDRLLDAFEHDQRVTRHQTWQDLMAYSSNSANPVGQLVLQLHGLCLEGDTSRRAREMLAMSDAICTGLQLTNFWQDVRRDLLERDRIYIPLADAGLTGQQLGDWVDRPNEPPVRRRMCDEVLGLAQRTRVLFAEGADLPAKVPSRRLGWMIWLFLKGGEETLSEVERSKGVTLWQRPTLSTNQRLSLVLQATLSWLIGKRPTTRR
jgi:phytoene/squalene synthetase